MMRALAPLILALCLYGATEAQDPNYVMHFASGIAGPEGSVATMPCQIDILPGATDIQGWSFGVCHDPTVVIPIAIATGSTTNVIKNGAPADFIESNFDATIGVNQGVVICFTACATLGAGTDYEMLTIDYQLLAPNGTFADLNYCDTVAIGAPPTETVVVVGGSSVVPSQLPGQIEIDDVVPPISLAADSVGPVPQGGSATVGIRLSNPVDVYGFSFGFAHDAGALQLDSVARGADLALVNGGAGPEFEHIDMNPSGGTGFLVGVLITSETPPIEVLPPGTDQELFLVGYSALPSAPEGVTGLDFVGTLSPPDPAPPTPVVVSVGESSVVPTTTGGSVEIELGQTGTQFIRGDTNATGGIDLSDAVFLLTFLFSGGDTPTCQKSADVNDTGGLDLGDPVYLLNFQFTGGPAPLAPYPDCGVDTTDDPISCDAFAACP